MVELVGIELLRCSENAEVNDSLSIAQCPEYLKCLQCRIHCAFIVQ